MWTTTLEDRFIQGKSSKLGAREGVNKKELWVLVAALEEWKDVAKGKLVKAALANFCAGRCLAMAGLARRTQEIEFHLPSAHIALRVPFRDISVADALTRYSLQTTVRDSLPERQFRNESRVAVAAKYGKMVVDLMACGDGSNASLQSYRPLPTALSKACCRPVDFGGSFPRTWSSSPSAV